MPPRKTTYHPVPEAASDWLDTWRQQARRHGRPAEAKAVNRSLEALRVWGHAAELATQHLARSGHPLDVRVRQLVEAAQLLEADGELCPELLAELEAGRLTGSVLDLEGVAA